MKYLLPLVTAAILLFTLTNCANGKKIQAKPPVALEPAYYTNWDAESKSGPGFTLFIPVKEGAQVVMDSVYFRGMRAKLEKSGADSKTLLAYFRHPAMDGGSTDLIMHADPKKEYGNQAPVLPDNIPFELEMDEAVVRYTLDGNSKYFKITGIQERPAGTEEIKKPENIRH